MKITFLGTSHGITEKNQFCSSALVSTGGKHYLVDAGAPVLTLLKNHDIPLTDVAGVFITHSHHDHFMGLCTLTQQINEFPQIADDTAQSMEKVAKNVRDVVTAMEKFAERYEQQTVRLGQVAEGIDQISAVVQTNSATAEETAASSEELTSQAKLLKTLTDQFRMDDRFHEFY